MSEPLLSSSPVANPVDPLLAAPAVVPSAEVEARIRRLGHAALHASHPSTRMTRWEWALSASLILGYAAYAATQIVVIFQLV